MGFTGRNISDGALESLDGRSLAAWLGDLQGDQQAARIINGYAKVGATAGWVVGDGAVDKGLLATCPASQTASTLVVPVPGLRVGLTISAFFVTGQIESAGGAVTLDADLRKMTAAAADVADASVGAITQVSVTADTLLSSANAGKTGLTEVIAEGETFYVLITTTTAGSTDIALQGVGIVASAV